ncbi:DUF2868 domain-containing protein [Massilia sp. BJB1822]|uniref:DUF2868 domain-containing protein n=1 Tax=Massilia sp. BJB1822 TaxID=2744470 RepID=UPI001592FFCD|nr:DUF2868 domain-containing protein [Massilia sp. BJB1822]NVE01223.1 DUF2868 domain-containing protein [Massilia sp. BJB1822]
MNERHARDVVLVRAIETADQQREILSEDDRSYASRAARELAQWQAAESKSAATQEHFLQQRAEQIIKKLGQRTPAFAAFVRRRPGLHTLVYTLPLLALLLGAGLDRITDPHHADLLSAPLLIIIFWNLAVYLGMLLWLCWPKRRANRWRAAWIQRLGVGRNALPRKLPHAMSSALFAFMGEWTQLSARLNGARLACTIHLSAAAFALGATASLYARGLLVQYAAGWESTFLSAEQVHGLLSILFAPAILVFHLPGFTLADVQALHFPQAQAAPNGALWVHLYAATLLLLAVAPRLVLAALAGLRARWLARRFPLDLEQPYFRKLGEATGQPAGALRVLPFSFTVDEARSKGLQAVAASLLGEKARVQLAPAIAYGDELRDAFKGVDWSNKEISLTAALFNLAATPERESHGAFLAQLIAAAAPRGVAVLIDESGFAARNADAARLAERVELWRQFSLYHGVDATIVNLLQPELRALEQGAGLPLSGAL